MPVVLYYLLGAYNNIMQKETKIKLKKKIYIHSKQ